MMLNPLQKLALTVYFELGLVNSKMQAKFIENEFLKVGADIGLVERDSNIESEDIFWTTLESTGIKLPYIVNK